MFYRPLPCAPCIATSSAELAAQMEQLNTMNLRADFSLSLPSLCQHYLSSSSEYHPVTSSNNPNPNPSFPTIRKSLFYYNLNLNQKQNSRRTLTITQYRFRWCLYHICGTYDPWFRFFNIGNISTILGLDKSTLWNYTWMSWSDRLAFLRVNLKEGLKRINCRRWIYAT